MANEDIFRPQLIQRILILRRKGFKEDVNLLSYKFTRLKNEILAGTSTYTPHKKLRNADIF